MTAKQRNESLHSLRPSRSEQTRTQILEAANRLFTERGYDGTGIRDLEAEAGVKRGVVTYHFGNKQDVWKAMFAFTFLPYLDEIRSMIPLLRSLDPKTRLRVLIENFVRTSAARPYMNQLMVQENFTRTWRSEWICEQFLQPMRQLNHEIAEDDQLLNRIESDPHFRYILLGACASVFSHRCEVASLFQQDVSSDTFIDQHVAAVLSIIDSVSFDSEPR